MVRAIESQDTESAAPTELSMCWKVCAQKAEMHAVKNNNSEKSTTL